MFCLKHREKYARIAVSRSEVVVRLPRLDARRKRPCERLATCTFSSSSYQLVENSIDGRRQRRLVRIAVRHDLHPFVLVGLGYPTAS